MERFSKLDVSTIPKAANLSIRESFHRTVEYWCAKSDVLQRWVTQRSTKVTGLSKRFFEKSLIEVTRQFRWGGVFWFSPLPKPGFVSSENPNISKNAKFFCKQLFALRSRKVWPPSTQTFLYPALWVHSDSHGPDTTHCNYIPRPPSQALITRVINIAERVLSDPHAALQAIWAQSLHCTNSAFQMLWKHGSTFPWRTPFQINTTTHFSKQNMWARANWGEILSIETLSTCSRQGWTRHGRKAPSRRSGSVNPFAHQTTP